MPLITRKKILLIEDEEEAGNTLAALLTQGGFAVMTVREGKVAIDVAKKEHPDLIILDIVLPGMSGIDVLVTLKNNPETKGIRVVVLSQLADQDSISRCIALGAIGYLVKSEYQLDDVVAKVKEILK